jgi:hypothetical protein
MSFDGLLNETLVGELGAEVVPVVHRLILSTLLDYAGTAEVSARDWQVVTMLDGIQCVWSVSYYFESGGIELPLGQATG